MHLTPKDIEKLMLHNAGFLAQKRYARGLKLNYPESIALIAAQLLEFIREGESVAELMDKGKKILSIDDVMPGVPEMIHDVQIEGTFPDGTKLVTVHDPICSQLLKNGLALYGSGLTKQPVSFQVDNVINESPGEKIIPVGDVVLNEGRKTITLDVVNKGDRPIQVGSHYIFVETNPSLVFDRVKAIGFRLNIPAGTAVRFEPGEKKNVQLVEIAGEKKVFGGNNLINGSIEEIGIEEITRRMGEAGLI
ncbi:MAG: urease subunit gamma [Opitutaceae bacterium]|nr:urease subunit gamma [Cytophagales bacterium]